MRLSRLRTALIAAITVITPLSAHAEGRTTLGFGRLVTNDYLGDGKDRWRTTNYTLNWVRGRNFDGTLPAQPFDVIEYRFRVDIIAPGALTGPGSDDRAYAGTLSFGLHTHYKEQGVEVSAGVDLNVIGPQTGLADAQDRFHDLIGQPRPSADVLANQVPDAVYLSPVIEMAYPVALSDRATVRPFVEAKAGAEEVIRIGADLMFGEVAQSGLLTRDNATGHLIRPVRSDANGWGFVLGADAGIVGDSAYFPATFGTQAEDTVYRARIGAIWQGYDRISVFYGMTYLSPEYVGQTEGQVLGSVALHITF